MSLQDVEKKIVASAQAEATEITEKAEAEAKADLERRSAALRDEQQRTLAAGKAEADAAAEREINTRRADHMMKVLEAKNEILNAIFDGVRDRSLAAQGFDYGRWLAAQVRRACARGVAGVLYCTDRDRAAVEAVVRESGGKNVTVGPEPGLMRGGVYLVGEGIDLDLTLDAALGGLRDELDISLAERLFGDVPPLTETAQAPGG